MEEKLTNAVREELTWLGKALLNVARQRAQAENVKTSVIIREGEVQAEICRFLQEINPSLLLLGAPRNTSATIFGDDAVEVFAASIQEQTGVEVSVVRPESAADMPYAALPPADTTA
jgi:hypothetical protein